MEGQKAEEAGLQEKKKGKKEQVRETLVLLMPHDFQLATSLENQLKRSTLTKQ